MACRMIGAQSSEMISVYRRCKINMIEYSAKITSHGFEGAREEPRCTPPFAVRRAPATTVGPAAEAQNSSGILAGEARRWVS